MIARAGMTRVRGRVIDDFEHRWRQWRKAFRNLVAYGFHF
jgi:hypothetical protein